MQSVTIDTTTQLPPEILPVFPVFSVITEYIVRGHSTVDNLVGYNIWGAVVTEVQVR